MSSINIAKWRSAGNLITETSALEPYARSQEALATSSDELVFAVSSDKKAKASKKKAKSLSKKNKTATTTSAVDSTVVRTSSLPNVLDESPGAFLNSDRGGNDLHG